MHRRALVVGNGAAGAEKQALALARALGDPFPYLYRTPCRSWAERVPAAWACPFLHCGGPKAARVPEFAGTINALPRGAYVIGCGRSVAGLVASVKRLQCVPRRLLPAASLTSHLLGAASTASKFSCRAARSAGLTPWLPRGTTFATAQPRPTWC